VPRLNAEQIAKAAHAAGFRGAALATATAIALAESGGNPMAHNDKPPDDSYGLWQVNYYAAAGIDREARIRNLGTPESMYDPFNAARAAFIISRGGTYWRDWSVYLSGAYRLHMPAASAAAAKISGGEAPAGGLDWHSTPVDPLVDVPGALSDLNPLKGIEAVGAFFVKLLDPSTWRRVLLVLGGGLVVGVALALVFRDALADAGAAYATGGAVTNVPTP
jgi:hypothetical protein